MLIVSIMDADKIGISELLKGGMGEIIGEEELMLEVARDIVKDEIKVMIMEALDKNPELKKEFHAALRMYLEAKVREVYASLLLAKSAGKLGLEVIPDDMKNEISREIVDIFEKEITAIIEKAV